VRRQDEVCHPAGYTIPYEELIQQGKNKASLVVDLPWRVLRGEPEALIVEQNIVASYSREIFSWRRIFVDYESPQVSSSFL
jgi:hypothetical protein